MQKFTLFNILFVVITFLSFFASPAPIPFTGTSGLTGISNDSTIVKTITVSAAAFDFSPLPITTSPGFAPRKFPSSLDIFLTANFQRKNISSLF